MADEEEPTRRSMKRLSDAETEMLISLVQRSPCLWNEGHADFTNTALRRKLWSLVGGHLHITGDEAKCKWKNLKDKFRKLRNNQDVRSSLGITPVTPKWKFYNAMLFTKDVLPSNQPNGSFASKTSKAECVVSDDSSSAPSNVEADSHNDDLLTEIPPDLESTPSPTPQCRRGRTCDRGTKRKKNSGDNSGKMPQLGEKRSALPSVGQEDKKGDDYHFLMSLLPFIEALDPLKKLELRFGIQKLVTNSYKKHVSKKGFKFRQSRANQTG